MIDKLTIGMYQDIKALPEDMKTVTKSIHIASILSDISVDEVRKWKITKLKKHNSMYAAINFKDLESKRVQRCKLNGVEYRIIDDPKDMDSGQLIDIINTMKGNDQPISIMDRILAILSIRNTLSDKAIKSLPIKTKAGKYDSKGISDRAALYQDVLLKDVWGLWVFFWNLWIRYCDVTEDYLDDQMMKTVTEIRELLNLDGRGSSS